MRRAQDRARSARSRKNGARSATFKNSGARSAQWECAREARRFFPLKSSVWLRLETLFYSFFWIWEKLLHENLCNFWTKPQILIIFWPFTVWRLVLSRNHIDLTTVVPFICQTGNLLSDVLYRTNKAVLLRTP